MRLNIPKINNYNEEIMLLICLIQIIVLVITIHKIKKIKNKESSPERVIRLKTKRANYHINKNKKLISTENHKRELDHSFNTPTPSSKRIKVDSNYCNKQKRANETEHQLKQRLGVARNKISNQTPQQKSIIKCANKIKQQISRKNKPINQIKFEIEKFKESIFELMNQVCEICHRKFYREGIKNHYINEKIHENLCKVGFNFNINSKIICCHSCCHSCSSCLSNNKTPAISYLNLLYPGSVPDELDKLNLIEISCISRVKPYMKIMKMNNVFGQASFKGF